MKAIAIITSLLISTAVYSKEISTAELGIYDRYLPDTVQIIHARELFTGRCAVSVTIDNDYVYEVVSELSCSEVKRVKRGQ